VTGLFISLPPSRWSRLGDFRYQSR
jgi:hypothetical protein